MSLVILKIRIMIVELVDVLFLYLVKEKDGVYFYSLCSWL